MDDMFYLLKATPNKMKIDNTRNFLSGNQIEFQSTILARDFNLEFTALQLLSKAWPTDTIPYKQVGLVFHCPEHSTLAHRQSYIAITWKGKPTASAVKLSSSNNDTHFSPRVQTPRLVGKCRGEEKFESISNSHNVFPIWCHVNFRGIGKITKISGPVPCFQYLFEN